MTLLCVLFLGIVLTILTAVVAMMVILRLPIDYLTRPLAKNKSWSNHLSAKSIARNILGLLLVIGGGVMLFTPGQGVLTIMVGVMVMDFPGKASLERKLLLKPSLLTGLDKVRKRFKKPPLSRPQNDPESH